MRAFEAIAISALARVEVPAALWRKHRLGELDASDAATLTAAFERDYHGDRQRRARFAVVAAAPGVLEAAADRAAAQGLRAYDAVQLASGMAARTADPDCRAFACFDEELRAAAAAVGFRLIPNAATTRDS